MNSILSKIDGLSLTAGLLVAGVTLVGLTTVMGPPEGRDFDSLVEDVEELRVYATEAIQQERDRCSARTLEVAGLYESILARAALP